jgi:DNA-binding CsgD family transcriptional regulator
MRPTRELKMTPRQQEAAALAVHDTIVVSRRRLEVAQLAAEGLPAEDIAARLGISPVTLRSHFQALVGKLPASPDRPSLVGRVAEAARAGRYVPREATPPVPLVPLALSPAALRCFSPRREGGMTVRCAVPESIGFDTYLYVIRRPDTREVKIGISRDPVFRLSCLQGAHGAPLEMVMCMPGTEADEDALHARFHSDRLLGEWFRESPAITAWIAEHAA